MVQKVVVELHEYLAQPFVADEDERAKRLALISSPAMAAAMSIPALLFQAVFFPVHHPEQAILEKLATGGYGENGTLVDRWHKATEMLMRLSPFTETTVMATVLFDLNDCPVLGHHYTFMVQMDGRLGCLTR
jgi:hypothetical protein